MYRDTLHNWINGTAEPSDEVRALVKGELRAARAAIVAAIPSATDQALVYGPPKTTAGLQRVFEVAQRTRR
jgi:hypothetical protein